MTADIRAYLIERFRGDAVTLRQRAAALAGATKPAAGPDATVSSVMAVACEDVATLAEQLPTDAPVDAILRALQQLLPELIARSNTPAALASPAVRSVYVGACTRVQELVTAETSALANDSSGVADDDELADDEFDEFDEDALNADDADADDDDLLEDDDDPR